MSESAREESIKEFEISENSAAEKEITSTEEKAFQQRKSLL